MTYKYANNAVSLLASPIGPSATTILLASGGGAKFPTITGSDTFFVTLTDAATETAIEILLVTAVVGDSFTVVRGQDGTSGQSWLTSDIVSGRVAAKQYRDFASLTYGGTFLSPIYGPTPAPGTNNNQYATTSWVQQYVTGGTGTGVTSFNTRTGAVVLTQADIVAALGYTPVNKAGDTMTGPLIGPQFQTQ